MESEDNNTNSDSSEIQPSDPGIISLKSRTPGLPSILDWRYFEITKFADEKKVLARCKSCPNKFLPAQIDSTSNLLKHLKVVTCLSTIIVIIITTINIAVLD